MLERVLRGIKDPVLAGYAVRARLRPSAIFRRYAARARAQGFGKVHFVLSFDCDSDEDIAVVWDLHARLLEIGVRPVYAVPGELLQRGQKTYRRIAGTGAEFLNHGYRDHGSGRFFYDQQSPETVREDVVQGDRCLREVLGVVPRGFRTPHFGTYQRPAQLRHLHGVLGALGYRFSTSTMPLYGFRYGPAFDRFGVTELPLSGMGSRPLTLLDTWGCFKAPDRRFTPEDYRREGTELLDRMSAAGAGLLNLYGDPSHVHESELFFEIVRHWREHAVLSGFDYLPPFRDG